MGIAYTKDPRKLNDPDVDGLVVVRNERVEFSRRLVWMWRVMCGDKRRGREICLEAVNWVVLIMVGEFFNTIILSCTKELDASHGSDFA